MSSMSLAAFRTYIEDHRSEILVALRDEIDARTPGVLQGTDAERTERVGENIDAYLEGLEQPEHTANWVRARLMAPTTTVRYQQIALEVVTIYRRHFMELGLHMLAAGIEGAADGLRGLIGLTDIVTQSIGQFFASRLQQFELLAENALDGIGMATLDGTITYANPQLQQMSGYGDQLIGQTVGLLYAPGSRAILLNEGRAELEQHGRWQGILPALRPDGTEWTAQVSVFVLFDQTGTPVGQAAVFRDITTQQQHESELHSFKALIENALDGIILMDPAGITTYANQAYRALVGRGDELIGAVSHEHTTLTPEELNSIMEQMSIRGAWRGEVRYRRIDDRIVPAQVSSFIITDSAGKPQSVGSIVRDITDQLRNEQTLREQETLLMAVLDNLPSLVHAKDTKGHYILANTGFCELLKVERDWLMGKTDDDFLPAQFADEIRAHDQETMKAGTLVEREIDISRDDHELLFLEAKFPLYGPNGELFGTAAISTDITSRRRMERERAAFQEQIIEAQQNALRELSTPLIPLADGLVAMPLIGSIDSLRAQQVIEALLSGVTEHRASTAILDITGVPIVDTQVAGALLRAAQAIKLLGAQAILTGIRPEIAQTLVGLGLDLSGVVTLSSLQSGIAYVMGRNRQRLAGKS